MGTITKKPRATLDEAALAAVKTLTETFGGEGEDEDEGQVHLHFHQGGASTKKRTKDEELDDLMMARIEAMETTQKTQGETLDKVATALDGLTKAITSGRTGDGSLADDKLAEVDGPADEIEAAQRCKIGDSLALETSFRTVIADAEVLVPGVRVPAFDPATPRRKTLDSLCQLRRQVLSNLALSNDGLGFLKSVSGAADPGNLDKLSCSITASIFRSAAGARRAINNAAGTKDANKLPIDKKAKPVGPSTPAELNQAFAKHYSGQRTV